MPRQMTDAEINAATDRAIVRGLYVIAAAFVLCLVSTVSSCAGHRAAQHQVAVEVVP